MFGLVRAMTGKTGLQFISVELVRYKIHSDCCGILYIKPESIACCTLSV